MRTITHGDLSWRIPGYAIIEIVGDADTVFQIISNGSALDAVS
jgi:hypothetical protein